MKQRQTLLTVLAVLLVSASAAHFVEKRTAFSQSAPNVPAGTEIAMAGFIPIPPSVRDTPLPEVAAPSAEAEIIRVQDVTAVPVEPLISANLSAPKLDRAPVTPVDVALTIEALPMNDLPVEAPILPDDVALPGPLPIPSPSPGERLALTKNAIDPTPPVTAKPDDVNEFGITCGVILAATETAGYMANLTVTAPCRSNQRITIEHEALIFTAAINDLGSFAADIPVLSENAQFLVRFEDGETVSARLEMPDAPIGDRVVLQFAGDTGLQIHALEFGAGYGDQGHVWAENPRDAASSALVGGGFLTRLGDSSIPGAARAEVYTFPLETGDAGGVVRLSVEAEVTQSNCGRDIAGETIQADETGALRSVSLTLSMPDCDAVGEFLVLKNLLRDLKIAAN